MSDELKTCPNCQSLYGYALNDALFKCPECDHEWNPGDAVSEAAGTVVKDANGNILQNGDDVVLIKDLPVKGAPKPLKSGTKVKNIRLTDGDHNISCRIGEYGA